MDGPFAILQILAFVNILSEKKVNLTLFISAGDEKISKRGKKVEKCLYILRRPKI